MRLLDARGWLLLALPLLHACASSVERERAATDLSHCIPHSVLGCPCYGGSIGRQVCDDSGQRYAACGCEAGVDGTLASTPSGLDESGAVPGIACGVAFPVLCAPESEICCVRSLSVDSCIPSSTPCACGDLDCIATSVRCDGPEDCAGGQVCCGTPVADADDADGYSSFACAARCASDLHQREACHIGQSACPSGLLCSNSQYLTNMQVCVDPASLAQ